MASCPARPRQAFATTADIVATAVRLVGAACIIGTIVDLLVVTSILATDIALVTHSVNHGAGLVLELLVSVRGTTTPWHGRALRHKFLNLAVIEGHCAQSVVVARLHRRVLKVQCVLVRMNKCLSRHEIVVETLCDALGTTIDFLLAGGP